MRTATMLVSGLAWAIAQTSSVPYAPDSDGPGPTFSIARVDEVYPGLHSSLRTIDFRNFTFLAFDNQGRPVARYPLEGGRYQRKYEYGYEEMEFLAAYRLRAHSTTGAASALVVTSNFTVGGSSSSSGIATLFTIAGKKLRVVQRMNWSTHGQAGKPIFSFDPARQQFTIRSDHYMPGDAHCCISAADIVTYRWTGSYFSQVGIQTELSEYGRSAGKVLTQNNDR